MTSFRYNMSSLKTLNISPYINEQNLTSTAPPTAISTGSPQVSFTYNSSTMVPGFSGTAGAVSYKAVFGMNVTGQNTSGAAVTLNWQVNKNGTLWHSGNSSITNNNYYNLSIVDAPSNGDKYDFYFWCSVTSGMNYFYQNSWCMPSRVDTGAKYLYNLNITENQLYTSINFPLAGTKINASGTGGLIFYPSSNQSNTLNIGNVGSTITIPVYQTHATYKLFQMAYGDQGVNYTLFQNSTTYNCQGSVVPSQIQYREIFFR